MPESLFQLSCSPKACNFIKNETLAQHRCFPVNFVTFKRTTFLKNTSGRLLLHYAGSDQEWQENQNESSASLSNEEVETNVVI